MTSKSFLLPRMYVVVILAAIYTLGFIITPYWIRAKSTPGTIFVLALTIAVGAIWSFISAKDLQIRVGPIHWGRGFILLAGLVVLNLTALTVDVPWRGDEGIHITRTMLLATRIPITWVIVSMMVFILAAYLAWKKSKWSIFLGISYVACVIVFNLAKNPLAGISSSILLRYPFFNYWIFAIIPSLAMLIKVNPYQEVFFRIVPFLSIFALVWIFQNELSQSKTFLNLLWGLMAATIPIVYYYSSILYLELPAVFLMLIVCLNIQGLLSEDYQKIRQNPAWYALILMGFIKETTIPFLICFLGWRLIASLVHRRFSLNALKRSLHALGDELLIALAGLLPVLFYLFLRGTLSQQTREFSLKLSNLTQPILYLTILRSFLEQFCIPLLLLFCGGCILLFVKREYLSAGFLLSLFFLYPVFYAVDTLTYAGYSRFNLFALPAVLAGSVILIQRLMTYRKIFGALTACAILVINLWASPVFVDGTKKPLWGNYLTDTSEHYYPYRQALGWLKNNYGTERIMFSGMYYPYPFDFYFGQLQWTPINTVFITNLGDSDSESLSRALAAAQTAHFNIVLFQVLGKTIPDINGNGPFFYEEKIFRNDAHILIVYHRKP